MNKKVIVYSTNWCPYCTQAKKYLSGKDVEVVEKNIEEDDGAREELLGKINGKFSGVPVLDIDGKILEGFNRKQIDLALKD